MGRRGYLHASLHDLAVVVNGPHAHHALLATTDDAAAVRCTADGSHSPLVGVMDGVQQLATLWTKSTNFAIAPPTDDALTILHSTEGLSCWSEHGEDAQSFLHRSGPCTGITLRLLYTRLLWCDIYFSHGS